MNDIVIKNILNLNGVDFTFRSPLEILSANGTFSDQAFEDNGGEIPLTEVTAEASKEFSIKGTDDIKFGVNAGGHAALGVYRDSGKLIKALEKEELSEQLRNLLNLKIKENENLLALRWGYNFGASVNGKVGLFSSANPVKLNFGVSGKTSGLSVLLHSVPRTQKAVASLKETLETWKTPYQVERFEDLDPKTTVIYETMGNLDLALGVEYGYNFNWAREAVTLGGLSGDIGFKIEAGIKAQFGFTAVGKYALALTRESKAETIRAQVFKMKENGITFSLDGGVSGKYTGNIIPEKLDDFVKGVFNLNGLQVLKDFEKWTDPNIKIEDLLGKGLEKYAIELIEKVTGINVGDSEAKLKEAIGVINSLIKKWHELPHELNSYLYSLLGKVGNVDINLLKEALQKVVDFGDSPEELSAYIQGHLQDIEFFTTPFGKWLSAYSQEGIVSILANLQTKTKSKEIAGIAKKTLGFIDGSKLAEQMKKLQGEIDEKLNLKVIKELDPDKWHAWLVQRLKDFLGVKKISDELEKIKKAINDTRAKAADFYAKGYEALKKKYSFDFHYAFQKTTGNSALIDATLDFSGANLAEAEKYLREILKGDFKAILTNTNIKCVKLNQAVLTHEIKRNSHLGVNVPYFTTTLDHITNSVAQGKFVDAADGKLWVYTLNAEDIVKKKKSLSRLAISLELSEKAGIRKFSEEGNLIDYTFYFGARDINRKYIAQRYRFSANKYLGSAFPAGATDFDTYLLTTDKFLDKNGYPDSNDFGTVLMDLKVSLPGKVMSAWEKVPDTTNTDFYKELSTMIQTTLREWVPLNYIQGAKEYKNTRRMFPLLAYASLTPQTEKIEDGVFYWDFRNDSKKQNEFNKFSLQETLRQRLADARDYKDDDRYKDSNLANILRFVLTDQNGEKSFHDLCDLEEDIIKGVVKTAQAFNNFKEETDPDKKAQFLRKFGMAFADTFNEEFGLNTITQTPYTPKGSLRPLGMSMFLKIVKLVTPEFDETKFAAMLELLVLDPKLSDTDFKKYRKEFLNGEFDEKDKKFALRQRIVNVDAT